MKLLLDAGADINARITDTTSLTARIARDSTMTKREGPTTVDAMGDGGKALRLAARDNTGIIAMLHAGGLR